MKKIVLILSFAILLFAGFASAQDKTYDREKLWEKEIDGFAEIDRRQTPPENAVLFVGSSSIRLWVNLRQSFPGLKVINRGFGGSRLEDVNHYFDRIIAPYRPKTIVLYAGENDVNEGISPEQLAENYRRFAALVREKLPKTKIFYVSLKPSPSRWAKAEEFRKANQLIKAETEKDKRTRFVDVFSAMLGPNGEPMPDIFVADNLHMNEKGYAIWQKILEKLLK
ncbi:MAG: SGNH/GDSL hydrolase family protein [Pyrinomonadaceae bacterium]